MDCDEDVYSWLLNKKNPSPQTDEPLDPIEAGNVQLDVASSPFLMDLPPAIQQEPQQQRKRQRRTAGVTASATGPKSPPNKKKKGARDKETAKEARRRKKEKVNELEEKVNALENENLELRLQLKVGKETVQRDEQEKWTITRQLEEMVNRNATNKEFEQVLKTYVKKFSDYGTDRSKSIKKHMEQLERLLLPTQVTKMCMWTLLQNDEFYRTDDDVTGTNKGLWSIVCNVIEATDDQKEKIKQYRDDAKQLAKFLRHAFREAEDLKKRMERKNRALAVEMRELQSVLTPQQLAKFILWVNNNPASMAMLDQLWNPEDDARMKKYVTTPEASS